MFKLQFQCIEIVGDIFFFIGKGIAPKIDFDNPKHVRTFASHLANFLSNNPEIVMDIGRGAYTEASQRIRNLL